MEVGTQLSVATHLSGTAIPVPRYQHFSGADVQGGSVWGEGKNLKFHPLHAQPKTLPSGAPRTCNSTDA